MSNILMKNLKVQHCSKSGVKYLKNTDLIEDLKQKNFWKIFVCETEEDSSES